MKKSVWLLMLALAGCAETGNQSSPSSIGAPVVETEARAKAKVYTELGFAYLARGQMKVALDEARKSIMADSNYSPAYNLLGVVYMELTEDKLAEENFRKSIDLDRSNSDAHNNYGLFLCLRGRYDEGLNQFTEALRNPLYDKPEQSLINSGTCIEKRGDYKQAESYYNKALKLQPTAPQPIIRLANLHFLKGDLNEAQRMLTKHQEVSPHTSESLWLGLRIERKLGDRGQEAFYNQQLRKRFPDSPETKLLLQGQYE